jgi:membrane protease YdiL (CAAX protease family)
MPFRRAWAVYLAAAITGELLLGFVPAATALIDSLVIVAALTQFGWAQRSPLAIGDPAARLLPAVALLPLMRLLSLTMPVPALPPIAWIALAGAPLLLAVAATARLLVVSVRDIGLTRRPRSAGTVLVILLSLPAGLLLGMLAPAELLRPAESPLMSGLVAFTVVSCGAIPEELIFRGIMQPLVGRHIGGIGTIVVGLAFAATYAGTGSPAAIAVMAIAGLAYGFDLARTGSLWGPLIGHSVLAASATVVGPLIGVAAI